MNKIIENKVLNENYKIINHKSGLSIYLYKLEGFYSTYVQFGAKLGSVNTDFKTNEDENYFTPPYGVAHFLEHKMFEDKNGDAFERFGLTGANANAFTSFDKTCYLFSCTDNLYKSLEILLDFVTTPYFTKEGTEKEKGIIAQEINMYRDNADWCVFFNLLQCIYKNHPVKIDIAGTVESINDIDKDILYKCYNTFYNLNNMVLSVVGNFEEEKVLEICDKVLTESNQQNIYSKSVNEPEDIVKNQIVQNLPVSIPIFDIGFKEKPLDESNKNKVLMILDIVLEYIAGETSSLYQKMYKEGLINSSFGYEVLEGNGYCTIIFGGESKNPKKVYEYILSYIDKVKIDKIPEDDFTTTKKAIYGNKILGFESTSNICYGLVNSHFHGGCVFDFVEDLKNITLDDVNLKLSQILNKDKSAISIIESGELHGC